MGKILIGWDEQTLVPDKKVRLAGQFYERISQYVESEITVTAMAIEADGDSAIIISADMTNIPDFIMEGVREEFALLTDEIDPSKIMILATHTHTSHTVAPYKELSHKSPFVNAREILKEFMPPEKEYKALVTADDSVLDPKDASVFVVKQMVNAAYNAWKKRSEAYYLNAFGRAAVGMCRRVCYNDGTAEMWGDTNRGDFSHLEGGNDSGIELIYVFDKEKKLAGVVANIACPSQILEQRSFISADFWGRAKAIIREKLGSEVYLLALGGAGGDQCPRDLIRWVQPETPIDDPNVNRPYPLKRVADPSMFDISGCNRAGKRIANEIISVYEDLSDFGELKCEAKFEHKVLNIDLPLRKVTKTEYEHAVREMEYFVQKNADKPVFDYSDNAKMHVHSGTVARYRMQQMQETYTIESHVMRLGDVAFTTNPFELFLDYGNRIKARSYARQTFIAQLCCGQGGYLPTKKAEEGGHYSAYVSSGKVGHEGGDMFVRRTLKEINEMFEGEDIYEK
ncbi:MAG: hypothetical protein J6Q85_02290 [Clostridia bacterium]|nr:hypothetical protein [Clostridia bacterium]